ncbi:High mobility group [Cichlidogyrus casuarinus]|uniref:High mobility group n=1 Tax=Cichlidogyrus casuarinus TaxID=1844966 RepID=A0ABD2Q413_9PLAT
MAKDKNKPKGAATAYAIFVQSEREEMKKKNPNKSVDFATFSKECSAKWSKMKDPQKKTYQDLAAKDKQRYEREMESYTPVGSPKKGKQKKEKDPNAPKRAMPAFFLFSNDERPKVKGEHPDWAVSEVAKELGERWKVCKNKAKYEQQAAQEKARYEKEMKNYKSGKK